VEGRPLLLLLLVVQPAQDVRALEVVIAPLVGGLHGGGQLEEPLDLDAVSRTHVADMVEIRRR